MMRKWWTPLTVAPAALALAACREPPVGPEASDEPVRTLLVHRLDTGENLLWDTDGTSAGVFAPRTRGMLPIATHPADRVAALLDGSAIVLTSLTAPDRLDTIIRPSPSSQSLATFSRDGRYLALVAYAPEPGLLVYDRANHELDTLSLGGADPVLPPVFSPDGSRIALITVTDLSILITIVPLTTSGTPTTNRPAVSRFTNRLLFGWPRWTEDGLLIAARRVAEEGPDTLLVGVMDPDTDGALLSERFRALLAPASDPEREVSLSVASTYTITADESMLALGAVPGNGAAHGIYLVTADGSPSALSRIRPLLDAVGQTPVYPLFIRE